MAQLVEHWPEKPVAVAMDAGSNPIHSSKGSFRPELTFSADSPLAFAQLLRAVMRINIVYMLKSQTLAAIPLFGHATYMLVGTSSADLVSAVAIKSNN